MSFSSAVNLRSSALICGLMLLVSVVLAQEPVKEDPLERQMLEIAKDLRCAVCQNQPVSESNAELARDMRQIIREQLQAGKSREQIVGYFVERYGDYVLMKPPVEGAGLVVWVLPLVLAAVLAVSALIYLKHRRRGQLPPPPSLTEEDRRRIERARREAEQ
jgi:cytochrome c-type biogenesis protein CcmH